MKTRPASLRRWRPRSWNREEEIFDTFDTSAGIAEPLILVELDDPPENRDMVTLLRAAEHDRLAGRLFHRVPITEATPWHDALERIVAMRIEYRISGETVTLRCPREGDDDSRGNRASADSIEVHAVMRRGRDGSRERTLVLPTDFAVADEYEPDPTRAGILLAASTELGIEEFAALVCDAVSSPAATITTTPSRRSWKTPARTRTTPRAGCCSTLPRQRRNGSATPSSAGSRT